MDLYTDPELYDAVHSWKKDDISFIVSQAEKYGGPVLELAAGTGRLGVPIATSGLHYTGLELSLNYVEAAGRKLKTYPHANMVCGDMRSFESASPYRFIFIGFNSLYHLLTENDITNCFRSMRSNLSGDGTFLIDIFMPDPEYLYRDPDDESEFLSFDHPGKGPCRVYEKGAYDTETQIMSVVWRFNYSNAGEDDLFKFRMRILFPDNMDRLLGDSGWVIREKYGDYDLSPLSETSPRQIYICEKR